MNLNENESQKDHALKIALEALDMLLYKKQDTSIILRNCLAVASLCGDSENSKWIRNELSGYEVIDNPKLPIYRRMKGSLEYTDKPNFESVEEFDIKYSVHFIESKLNLKEDLIVWQGENFEKYATLPRDWCYKLLSSVQDRCLLFLLNTLAKLRYGGKIQSIIETIQNEVNTSLIKVNNDLGSEMQSIAINLNSVDPMDWSKAVHSCRRVLSYLADVVYPASKDLFISKNGKSYDVGNDKYMNRLLAFVEIKNGDELEKDHLAYMAKYYNSCRNLMGKGEHDKISCYEAEQIVVHSYMIIVEILKLMKREETPKP